MGLSLKGILGTVAPILASALPGPIGGIARKVIANALQTEPSDAAIEKALVASDNTDVLVKLREAEQKFKLEMETLGINLEQVAAADRANARAMQIQTKQKTPAVLATVMVAGFILLVALLSFRDVPASNRDVIVAALGIFSAQLVTVYQYYFGSSSSSRNKDETIKSLSA